MKFLGRKGTKGKDIWKKLTGSVLGIIVLIIIIIAIAFGIALVVREWLVYHVYSVYTDTQKKLNLAIMPLSELKQYWIDTEISGAKYSGNPIFVFNDIAHLLNIKKNYESQVTT